MNNSFAYISTERWFVGCLFICLPLSVLLFHVFVLSVSLLGLTGGCDLSGGFKLLIFTTFISYTAVLDSDVCIWKFQIFLTDKNSRKQAFFPLLLCLNFLEILVMIFRQTEGFMIIFDNIVRYFPEFSKVCCFV